MRIDAHQHFWRYNPQDYTWMTDKMESLRRDYLPEDLAPLLAASGIDGTVTVQAIHSLRETRWLVELAERSRFIYGVVGWVDLTSPRVDEQLAEFAGNPKFRGVRHQVHDEPDDRFMLRTDFARGIGRLKQFGLTYDLLLFPRHLPVACELVERFPDQPFLLDHIAKPLVRDRQLEPWATDIRRLARHQNVFCKISGLVTEADGQHWHPADFSPYLDVVLEGFGAKRLMLGSDWPVCTLAGHYGDAMKLAFDYIGHLSVHEQAEICGNSAARFYGLQLRSSGIPGSTR